MPLSAWIMSIVVAIVLYGGLALCIRIAIKRGREERAAGEGTPRE